MNARLPDKSKRTLVLGRTGSGKTVFGMSLLSMQNFDEQPWVIIDYKSDQLIERLERVCKGHIKYLRPTDKVPTRPGIYIMRPLPDDDDENIERFFKDIWSAQDVGIYIDEGYMIPRFSSAFKAILTQGRSRSIPVIVLYQRPSYLNPFVVAQADYIAAFEQNNLRDLKTTGEFVKPAKAPDGSTISVNSSLPLYHCLWHDVGKGQSFVLRPAPDEATIIGTFARRLNVRAQKGAFI